MTLLLTPILEGLEAARLAAAGSIAATDEVSVDDQGDRWIFEFVPQGDSLGGGATVVVSKANLSILRMIRSQ